MAAEARERAFATLLRHAAARDNEPYLLGVAEGLGALERSARRRVARKSSRGRRTSLDVRQAAQRGLAVGFRDEDAIKALRRELDGKDEELELRAAQVLYELADEARVRVGRRRHHATPDRRRRRRRRARPGRARSRRARRRAEPAGVACGARRRVAQRVGRGVDRRRLARARRRVRRRPSRSLADDRRLGARPARRALDLARDQAVLAVRGAARDERRHVGDVVDRSVAADDVVDRQRRPGRALAPSVEARSARVVDGAAALAGRRRDRESAARRRRCACCARCSRIRRPACKASAALALARSERSRSAAADRRRLRHRADGRDARSAMARAARDAGPCRRPALAPSAATRALLAKAAADPDPGVRFIALAASRRRASIRAVLRALRWAAAIRRKTSLQARAPRIHGAGGLARLRRRATSAGCCAHGAARDACGSARSRRGAGASSACSEADRDVRVVRECVSEPSSTVTRRSRLE